MDLIAVLNDTISTLAGSPWVYLVVVGVCLIDGFFPPVPSETVVVAAAAVAASTGSPNMLLLVAVAALGAMAGDNIAFELGRRIGVSRFRWMRTPKVAGAVDWARRGLDRRGAMLIFSARYIPVGRIAVNMTAGATSYPRRRFIPLSSIAGLTWAIYSTVIGLVAGQWLHDQPLLAVVVAIGFAAVVGAVVDVVIRWIQRRGPAAPDRNAHLALGSSAVSTESAPSIWSNESSNQCRWVPRELNHASSPRSTR